MPTKKNKSTKVRDLKPRKDAKGGGGGGRRLIQGAGVAGGGKIVNPRSIDGGQGNK